ncbi:MAG: hypothetical protein E7602_04825 [Ruminococcaceae bacterium]|nr:hypothetical protein [Oscillospiraceae bacterium]
MSDNSLEKILAGITSNPELIEKISTTVNSGSGDMEKTLSSVISLISGTQSNTKSIDSESENIAPMKEKHEDFSRNSDTLLEKNDNKENLYDKNQLSFLNTFANSISKNSDFLLALKPYLNKERKEIIDNVVRISKIASIMNLAK